MTKQKPIAIITGAGQRIGRTLALGLAEKGWDIAGTYLTSADDMATLADEIKTLGQTLLPLKVDLRSEQSVAALLPACVKGLGQPALLINNASLFLEDDLKSLTSQLLDDHLAINLKAPLLLARDFSQVCHKEANIINLTDQRVTHPNPGFYSYTLSKMALASATITMAQALAPNIRVNAIAPGPVLQSIHQTRAEFEAECSAAPLKRGAGVGEIMTAVAFILATPSLTGETIHIDGGQRLG